MSEMHPERPIGPNQLSELVYGPAASEADQVNLAERQFNDGMSAYQSAYDRGDARAIEDAEQYLRGLLDTNPQLRQRFISED